jgi:hypothetical protein
MALPVDAAKIIDAVASTFDRDRQQHGTAHGLMPGSTPMAAAQRSRQHQIRLMGGLPAVSQLAEDIHLFHPPRPPAG